MKKTPGIFTRCNYVDHLQNLAMINSGSSVGGKRKEKRA